MRKGINRKLLLVALFITLVTVITILIFTFKAKKNEVIYDWNFSEGYGILKKNGWIKDSKTTVYEILNDQGLNNSSCAVINSNELNDARFELSVNAKSNAYYKMSVWVKTEDVGMTGSGANLSIIERNEVYGNFKGTKDWTKIELYGLTGKHQEKFTLALRLGGFSNLNKGKVYFDDLKVEKLAHKPRNVNIIPLSPNTSTDTEETDFSYTENDVMVVTTAALAFFLAILAIAYRLLSIDEYDLENHKSISFTKHKFNTFATVLFIILAGFILRVIIAPYAPCYPNDVNLFKEWAITSARNLPNFYNTASFIDYPPGYIIILSIIGKIGDIFNIAKEALSFTLLIKLPAILCDVAIAVFIYRICDKKMTKGWTVFLVSSWIFNPAVIMDSAMWGQVDSVLTLFIIIAVYYLSLNKTTNAAIFFTIAVMIKMQGIIFLPLLFFALIKKRSIKAFFMAFIAFVTTNLILVLPFAFKMDKFWIFSLYTNTAGGYQYASVNAMNFFYMINLNWVKDIDKVFGIPYFYLILGMIFIVIVTILTWIYYVKSSLESYYPFLCSIILMMGVFTFGPRMHERYFFPVLALLLIAAILANNRYLLWLYALITTTGLYNIAYILAPISTGTKFVNPLLTRQTFLVAFGNVLFSLIIIILTGLLIKGRIKNNKSFWSVIK